MLNQPAAGKTLTLILVLLSLFGCASKVGPDSALRQPWGASFLPRSFAPAGELYAVDIRSRSTEERIALGCLQGLVSRVRPAIWLTTSAEDAFWLAQHEDQGLLPRAKVETDWRALFARFASSYRGAVIPDPSLYRGDLLALNAAAVEDLIVASPELAASLGLNVVIDLRGRFSTYADGLEWLRSSYGDRFNRSLCEWLHPGRLRNTAFAYSFQWRAPMFWPAGPKDSSLPGAGAPREAAIIDAWLSTQRPGSGVMGFPYAGEGVGPGEVQGVTNASRHGLGLVCSDYLTNVCVLSAVNVLSLQRAAVPEPAPRLDPSAMYVALVLSDGDNQNLWRKFMRRYFDDAAFGSFPFAFGIGPPIADLQPGIAAWYLSRAPANTEFIADVSGIAYIQPDRFGEALAPQDRVRATREFAAWSGLYSRKLGLSSFRTVGGDDDALRSYFPEAGGVHSILADMGRYPAQLPRERLAYQLSVAGADGASTSIPVFRAATSWRYGRDFWRDVREQAGTVRPAFINGFVHIWTFDTFEKIQQIVRDAPPGTVFVTPSQLAGLYRQDESGTKPAR